MKSQEIKLDLWSWFLVKVFQYFNLFPPTKEKIILRIPKIDVICQYKHMINHKIALDYFLHGHLSSQQGLSLMIFRGSFTLKWSL